MLVEQHVIKAQFAVGAVPGFVLRVGRQFVERPGERDAYEIFEDREAAERALAAASLAPAGLEVQEVTVESVRDYQRLSGLKTIYLVDRAGRSAASIRIGEMPLAARTNTPFPGPLPSGLRVTTIPADPKPEVPELTRAHRGARNPAPLAHEPVDDGRSPTARRASPARSDRPGLLVRLLRFLLRKS